jgi:ABC-type sugar transport system substrate-binding protein
VKDEASHFSNVKVLSTDAKGDVAKLTSDVEDLLNQKVNVFIISGAWIEAAPAALEAINQAGVPIVMVDRQLKGGDFNARVGPDNCAIGRALAKHIVKRLNGKGKVAVIRGGPADTIGSNCSTGVQSKFKGH